MSLGASNLGHIVFLNLNTNWGWPLAPCGAVAAAFLGSNEETGKSLSELLALK